MIVASSGTVSTALASRSKAMFTGLSGSMRVIAVALTLLQLLHSSKGAVVTYTMDVAWRTTQVDLTSRRVITVNGISPGPTIKCMLGDTLEITVVNNIDMLVAIHWHGITQRGSPDQDGVPGITQKAIMPGATYVYKFTPSSPGTFWYHSHFHAEYVDGLRGPLVVVDPKAAVYRRDSVVMLTDWYDVEAEKIVKNSTLKPGGTGIELDPVSGLIGGLGQRFGSACSRGCPNTCASTQTATSSCPACRAGATPRRCLFKRIQAQPGGSCTKPATKLRFIAASGYTGFSVSIDEHVMQIVSTDLMPVKPVTVGTLYINVGQRYEVLVCRRTNPTSTAPAWIRVKLEGLNMVSKLKNATFLGILTYQNATANTTVIPRTRADRVLFSTNVATVYPQVPTTIDPMQRLDLDPWGLQLAKPDPVPAADRLINYTISFVPDMNSVMRGLVNGLPFTADLSGAPLLASVIKGTPLTTGIPAGLNMIYIKAGEVVDLFIRNLDYRIHPMHMHGYDVWVMARGKTNELPKLAGKMPALWRNPIMRDTVTVMPQSYIVLRVKADNPGIWLMHCHVEWHIAAGMANAFHVY